LLTSDCESETGDYNERGIHCQAEGLNDGVLVWILTSADIVRDGIKLYYDAELTNHHIPQPKPASNSSKSTITPNTATLNFLYRFLSGGASEPCGKYGGGVYVAI
jgi:hypothetical protein